MTQQSSTTTTTAYKGNDRVLLGFILGLLSFWLFAMTLLNINPIMRADLGIANPGTMNLAVSITSLFAGLFIVVAGGLADKYGRVRFTRLGFILSMAGSLTIALIPANTVVTVPMLHLGRILQGLAGACIMPSTLSLLREYWDERGRQRAISLWGMGTWGGTSFSSFVGGMMVTSVGWRAIFITAVLFSLLGMYLIRDLPESKAPRKAQKNSFDVLGILFFMIAVVALQLFLTEGSTKGWEATSTLVLLAVSVVFLILFIVVERKLGGDAFIDFSLFKNKTFTGAALSNFILNGTAGIIMVVLMTMQLAGGLSASTAGLLTLGYGVTVILFIRVGELLLRRFGPRKPMLWGNFILLASFALMLPTNIMTEVYMVLVVVAFILFGLGLAFYATPSTDAALMNLPPEKTGTGSGIYKMASSLGASFGTAISTAIFTNLRLSAEPVAIVNNVINFVGRQDNLQIRQAGMVAVLFNIVMILLSIFVISRTIPRKK